MSERRSSRVKKNPIKYATLCDDSDDDFADITPPPPKKTKPPSKKESGKDVVLSIGKTVADVAVVDSGRKRRAPLAEKIYERELQQALELSMVQSQDTPDQPPKLEPGQTGAEGGAIQNDENDFKSVAMPTLKQATGDLETQGKQEKNVKGVEERMPILQSIQGVLADNKIEVIDGGSSVVQPESGQRSRRVTSSSRAKQNADVKAMFQSDSEEESDFDNADDSEDDEDYDSDFGGNFKQTKNKKTPPPKKQPAPTRGAKKETVSKAATVTKSSVATKPPASNPLSKVAAAKHTTTPPPRQSASKSVAPSLAASWKPPALAGCKSDSPSSTLRSPSSGLRLGLSRNQRVKPLHPSVQAT